MWPYWVLFLFPALFALRETKAQKGVGNRAAFGRARVNRPLLLFIPILTLVIGWRYEVGGDWANYEYNLSLADYPSLADVFHGQEPGFELLQWIAINLDWGLMGVNFMAAAIFSTGLIMFCRDLPRPWLALVIATPYLIIVVAMGYTRQGLALGLCMLGLLALQRQRTGRFFGWILLAATFHNSAILLMPVAVLAATRRRAVVAVALVATIGIAFGVALQDRMEAYVDAYLTTDMVSQGALIRLSMNLLPALCLLRWHRRFTMTEHQYRLWRWFSIISIGLFLAYFVIPASTALDRIALYMLPLQLVVLGHLPTLQLSHGQRRTSYAVIGIIGYCAAIQFVWLNFAVHAEFWIPYRFYLIEILHSQSCCT